MISLKLIEFSLAEIMVIEGVTQRKKIARISIEVWRCILKILEGETDFERNSLWQEASVDKLRSFGFGEVEDNAEFEELRLRFGRRKVENFIHVHSL